MPATVAVDQEILEQIKTTIRPYGVRQTSVDRLALLGCGILAAQRCVLARVADELDGLALTGALRTASISAAPAPRAQRLLAGGGHLLHLGRACGRRRRAAGQSAA